MGERESSEQTGVGRQSWSNSDVESPSGGLDEGSIPMTCIAELQLSGATSSESFLLHRERQTEHRERKGEGNK